MIKSRMPWMLFKHERLEEILRLNPEKDFKRIVELSLGYELPIEYMVGNLLSYIKTFATIKISKVMFMGGESFIDSIKRAEDTDIILSLIQEKGCDSPEGKRAIEIWKEVHAGLPIKNEYYLYPLSSIIFDTIRWVNEYGWRPLSRNEELAYFYYWREIGMRMGIENIPATFDEFESYNLRYESENMKVTDNTVTIGQATDIQGILKGSMKLPLGKILKLIFLTFMDERAVVALGYRRPSSVTRFFIKFFFRQIRWVRRLLPPLKQPFSRLTMKRKSYPNGYSLSDLGPDFAKRRARLKSLGVTNVETTL